MVSHLITWLIQLCHRWALCLLSSSSIVFLLFFFILPPLFVVSLNERKISLWPSVQRNQQDKRFETQTWSDTFFVCLLLRIRCTYFFRSIFYLPSDLWFVTQIFISALSRRCTTRRRPPTDCAKYILTLSRILRCEESACGGRERASERRQERRRESERERMVKKSKR